MSRPIWKGNITFGLVNIPVQLQTATREKNVQFHRLSKDGSCRLRQKLYCPDTGKEYDYGDTARGIEVGKDEYVLVDEKEIEKLKPAKGRSIEIQQFVKLTDIDPIYFDRVYFVTPDQGASKSYRLLHEAMAHAKSIAVARFVMRDKEYLAVLRVMDKGILLHTLYYTDEVLSLDEALPSNMESTKVPPKELQMATQLVEAMTHKVDLSSFKDDYRERLEALVKAKAAGKKTVQPYDDTDETIPPTINLMEALKKSLAHNKPTTSTHRRKSA